MISRLRAMKGQRLATFPAGRVRLDVGPADVGRRLTLRCHGEGFGQRDREIVAVLDRWSGGLRDGILRLRKRDGTEVGVRVADIIAMRVVAPEISAYALQRLAQEGWRPLETHDLGSWTLRAANGATGRANSVRVAGAPPKSLAAALSEAEEWYGARELPVKLQMPVPSGLTPQFEEAGYVGVRTSRMMTNSVARLVTSTADATHRDDLEISVETAPNSDWWSLVESFSQTTAPEYEHAVSSPVSAFVYCRNTKGELLGIGHATLQGDWRGATTITTAPQSRRSGIASAVTAQMARWAQDCNARSWYLQFFEDNAAALSFYERLGFTTHHHSEYRWPGDVPEPWLATET